MSAWNIDFAARLITLPRFVREKDAIMYTADFNAKAQQFHFKFVDQQFARAAAGDSVRERVLNMYGILYVLENRNAPPRVKQAVLDFIDAFDTPTLEDEEDEAAAALKN